MDSDMLWTHEGFMLDEAGNLIMTSYVDLRAPSERTAIQNLVKGCRREHALEDGKTVLVSPVRRFRTEGRNLILDKNEGLAEVGTEIVEPETPADVYRRRRLADRDDAVGLLDSDIILTGRRTSRRVRASSERLTFGKEWWIFSTSIKPETDEEWAAWRGAIDPEYDHVSEIGQPAKFAEALARMVTEQLGPQSKDGWMRGPIGDAGGTTQKSKHPTQLVVHGPVVYTDQLYDTLARDADEATRIATLIFTKNETHAALREYRFAILRDGAVAEKVLLTISGMMRDALQPGTSALVRPAPQPAETAVDPEGSSSPTSGSTKLRRRHTTAKRRVTHRETMRSEKRGADGTISSSESAEREHVREKTVTWEPSPGEEEIDGLEPSGRQADESEATQTDREPNQDVTAPESETVDEDAIREIAFAEPASNEAETAGEEVAISRGTGRVEGRLEEMFREMWDDPAFPMPAISESWAEATLSPEEVLKIYGWVATLRQKVARVPLERREAVSSACWHAIQCVRNIYARLGDIIEAVSIERERFVVLRLKPSNVFKAAGRIVLAPSGAYAYAFKGSDRSTVACSEGHTGEILFPLGHMDKFESHGWPPKDD